jgi:sec-independent protein translocase protein TatA
MNVFTAGSLAFIGNLGGVDMIVIAAIGLLLFGKRLPEVGKNLGQAIVGFKKGLKDVTGEVTQGTETLTERTEELPVAKAKPVKSLEAKTVTREKKLLRPASEEP